jgi:hypothetical protein
VYIGYSANRSTYLSLSMARPILWNFRRRESRSLALSEKQIPRFIGNFSSWRKWISRWSRLACAVRQKPCPQRLGRIFSLILDRRRRGDFWTRGAVGEPHSDQKPGSRCGMKVGKLDPHARCKLGFFGSQTIISSAYLACTSLEQV